MQLDKQSKRVLKACIQNLSDEDTTEWFLVNKALKKISPGDVDDSLRYLKKQGLLNYDDDPMLGINLIWLSYEGLHYYDFLKVNFLKYIADKWISIAALVISFIALIISLMK